MARSRMGMGSRALYQRAQEQAYFIDAVNTMAKGALVPVPGGVLIMDGGDLARRRRRLRRHVRQ